MSERSEATGHLIYWWIIGIIAVVVTVIVLSTVSYVGVFTSTVVERKVFESSYQYSEARKTEIATYEAQLIQINSQLSNQNLSDSERSALEGQTASINVLLSVARSRQ